jgi:hypothetical protein
MSDERDVFLRPVFRGKRFEQHEVPVETLEEFRRYQELIIDLAKSIFFEHHPERQRVPRGFTDRFRLALSDVEEGSAAPVLRRIDPGDDQLQTRLMQPEDEFAVARDRLNRYLEALENDDEIEVPREVLAHFKSFGKSLREDESIEFARDASSSGPRLDRSMRRRVLRCLGETYEEYVELVGHVCEVDTSRRVFHLQTDRRGVVEVALAAEYEVVILDAHRQYRALEVRLEGTATFSPDGDLRKVVTIEDILLQDRGPELDQRFDELRELEDGWYHGEGYAPREDLIDAVLATIREAAYEYNAYLPYIYPTPEGGLQLEWALGSGDVEVEIEPDRTILALAEGRKDGTWDEWRAGLDDEDLAKRIATFIIQRDERG